MDATARAAPAPYHGGHALVASANKSQMHPNRAARLFLVEAPGEAGYTARATQEG
jgi:hypothetical protein